MLPRAQRASLQAAAARARDLLAGRVFWNVNATGAGGGVAESLQTFVGYLDDRHLVRTAELLEGMLAK